MRYGAGMLDTRFYSANGPFSLVELIAGLDVELPDAKFADEKITSAAALSLSKPGEISFLDNKRHRDQVDTAMATACFVPEKLAEFIGAKHIIPLISNAPRAHFGRVLGKLVSQITLGGSINDVKIAKSAKVHSTAVLASGAIIDEGAVIAPYAIIGPGVHIGARSFIGAHSSIECSVIGNDCKIKSGAMIGGSGFGVASDEHGVVDIPHIGRVIIGDRVSIGSQTCLDRGQLGDTVLEDDVKIDNLVQIAHNVSIGAGTVIAGHVGISGSCLIGKGVQMGGSVGLADHIKIGDGVSIAARSGVMHDIPAGEVWSGIPAMPIRDHMRMVSATRKLSKRSKG